jgi:citrate synthase
MVVLQKYSKEVRTSGAIIRRLTMIMDSWEAKTFEMLVQDTERTALAQLARIQGIETQDQQAKKFARLVLQGKLWSAVMWLTDGEKGGVLLQDDLDEKTGEHIIDVLKSKHPDAQVPDASEWEEYKVLPNFMDLDMSPKKSLRR